MCVGGPGSPTVPPCGIVVDIRLLHGVFFSQFKRVSEMTKFTENEWRRVRERYTAFWRGELPNPLVFGYGQRNPAEPSSFLCSIDDLALSAGEIVDDIERKLDNTICYGDAFPCFWPNFGPGLTTAMVDECDLHFSGGSIWFEPKEEKELRDIHIKVDLENEWFVKIREVVRLAVERFGSGAQVAMTDLGGNLDLLSACRTPNNLLLDLLDCPDEVKRVTEEFHDAWWTYYNELAEIIEKQQLGFTPWANTWAPGRTYIMQCDFASMISPDMFEEFVVPEIKKTCKKMDYAFFHLDGPGMTPHLDHLLAIEELHGIQWQPGAGAPSGDTWTDFVPRILEAGKLVQLITNREQTLNAIKNFGRKNIMYLMTESLSPENAEEFFKKM